MESSGRGPRWYLRSFAEIVRSLILAIRRCLDVGIEFPVFIAVMPITRSAASAARACSSSAKLCYPAKVWGTDWQR